MRAASDVGGTFTDLVYYPVDPETGQPGAVQVTKADTTPPDFEEGVMNAMAKAGLSPAALDFFAHGSTVVINALTERKGVKTALITTAGFRDVIEIARGNRPDLFNFNFQKPRPFVDRYLRAELSERSNFRGELNKPVDLAQLPVMLDFFRAEGVEAIAIAFLHAYVNPENERRTAEAIRAAWPEVAVLASHEVSREWREYERTNTTVLSAYVSPIARRYIERLERRLDEGGFSHRPYMMQSNCGIATVEAAKANPITMVESGPASGIYAAAYLGRKIGEPNLIVLDIGGTTAKCTLIEEGQIKVSTDYYIERDGKSPGYPVQTPVSEIVEIGNGGGSIAWVDVGGKLHVGPQSAGARPGPAAYGRGGTRPTTTDANLLLGRIDPESFVGGEVEPDWEAVDAAFAPLCDQLGRSKEELARGVIRIANANMTTALRLVSTNKGHDPRDFALMAFGGGGAMHAVALAEELKVPRVIIPVNSSVFSAWGMLLTDLRRDYIRTRLTPLQTDSLDDVRTVFAEIEAEAVCDFAKEAQGRAPLFEYRADLRYVGQEHTVGIAFPFEGADPVSEAIAAFHDAHEKRFTYRLDAAVQLVNFHLVATLPVDKPELAERAVTGRALADAVKGTRQVDFDMHGIHAATIYDGPLLEPGMQLSGPAVIQEPSVTLPLPPGTRAEVDRFGNYHVQLSA
ncbi:hydantoinase/oxoprolinase family protein [Novosphingobium mangrovi (ex Huang et al. 2023)]|uniref:Hydantoinase/oxoprolinase family protein n=1 Tax=Novosphingobium mangrovi (ex Huang et al. 2023) TaxID=2976432 RepID=A0ABT2I1X9_9SPHN|nr:hydantoinase/oxoprolinase family protein [Novosphingobium mangrovi (ex Huang et al. 2023)]MCT2398806.1 hydantoinase/oxoprolinase family protein [Novosphingobium mangrovi (ex Huang et al. 2023)]